MERTGWPKVMEVDGISLLQVAHIFIIILWLTMSNVMITLIVKW